MTTTTDQHDDLCRGLVHECIIENAVDAGEITLGDVAVGNVDDEGDFVWGVTIGSLIDQYLGDGTATCNCRTRAERARSVFVDATIRYLGQRRTVTGRRTFSSHLPFLAFDLDNGRTVDFGAGRVDRRHQQRRPDQVRSTTMTTPDQPIVARDLKWAPIRHFTGARLARVGWLVAFTAVEDGSHRTCCASTHGHKSKPAAMACLRRTINRMIRSAR